MTQHQDSAAGAEPRSLWRRCAIFGGLVAAAAILASLIDIPTVATVEGWLPRSGLGRWLAAAAALSVALIFPTPRSALSLLAGAMFGVVQGLPLVVVGGLVAALGGYYASRWLRRAPVTRTAGHRLARVDSLLRQHGLAAVATARMLPAPPFAVVSYVAGLSSVGVWPYLGGTAVGVIPGSVLYVTIGASVFGADAWVQWLTSPWFFAKVSILGGTAAAVWWARRRHSAAAPRPE